MRFSFIVTSLIVAIVIAIAVFQRDWAIKTFVPERNAMVLSDVQSQISTATKNANDDSKALEKTLSALEEFAPKVVDAEEQAVLAVAQERLNYLRERNVDYVNALHQAEMALAALSIKESELSDPEDAAPLPPLVEVLISTASAVQSGVELSGKVEAGRRQEVRAQTSGTISSAKIPAGHRFLVDELICQIDAGAREDALRLAETNLNATRRLQAERLASTAALQNAQAQYQNAKDEYDRSFIRAPFEGVSLDDTPETGATLSIGGLCVTLGNLDELTVVGYAAEAQVDAIKMGARAAASFANGKTTLGIVTNIADSADAVTKTYRIEMSLPNTAGVRDGSSAKMTIALDETEGHLLPQNALVLDPLGVIGVRTHDNGVARFVPVIYLRDVAEGVWVTGLPDEVEIIVTGQDYVADGDEIRVSYRAEASDDLVATSEGTTP